MLKEMCGRVVRSLLSIVLLWIAVCDASEMPYEDEEILVSTRSSFYLDSNGFQTFRVSDFFVSRGVALTNSAWLPGQGQIPVQLGQQAKRVSMLLHEQKTNAAQIILQSISIIPALELTNQSVIEFRFSCRLQTEQKTTPSWIVMLLNGTIATERPHVDKRKDSTRSNDSSSPDRTRLADDQVIGQQIKGVARGNPDAPYQAAFEIPVSQWEATQGDNYPADLCRQEALAASYLKKENQIDHTLTLESIVLTHYVPMEAIRARKLQVLDHLNHWQAIFYFRDTMTDFRYHVPVLLDDRIFGFTEFRTKTER